MVIDILSIGITDLVARHLVDVHDGEDILNGRFTFE
jgi:hypothetical protein